MKKFFLFILITIGVAQWAHAEWFIDYGLRFLVNDDDATVTIINLGDG